MAPSAKKRKTERMVVEEITFDPSARQEYLTGFHKRKLERAKHAKELAEQQARLDKLEARRQLRDRRKAELEKHVAEVNALLDPAEDAYCSDSGNDGSTAEEWNGVEKPPPVNHEAEYIDEGKYTTVTVEALDWSKGGVDTVELEHGDEDEAGDIAQAQEQPTQVKIRGCQHPKKRTWTKAKPEAGAAKMRKKKKKFRYETKAERKFTRLKEGFRNSREAKARREK